MQSDIDIMFRKPFIFMFRSNISDRTQHLGNKVRITTYRENMVIDVTKLFNIDVFFQILINFFENMFIFMFLLSSEKIKVTYVPSGLQKISKLIKTEND